MELRTATTSQTRRSSRAVGIAFGILAFIATACAWAGLSFKELLNLFHF
jgi:hypothetical protein